jgi:DNA mismatch repair ATPase MutS
MQSNALQYFQSIFLQESIISTFNRMSFNQFFLINRNSALSACAALFKFIETQKRHVFTPNSIRLVIKQMDVENTALIDLNTCRYLELVYNTRNVNKKRDLCSILDHTETKSGMAKLRCNVLQPPCDLMVINERKEIVERFIKDGKLLKESSNILKAFHGLDEVIAFCQLMKQRTTQDTEKDSIKITEFKIERILFMKNILKSIRQLDTYIQSVNLESFKNIFQVCVILSIN